MNMNAKEKLNWVKSCIKKNKVINLIKENKVKTLILLFAGVIGFIISYNMFSPPENIYKSEEESQKTQYMTPMRNPVEEQKRFYETANQVYTELDLQISAEQQFLTKRELHSLGDLAIESKYWLDKGENLQRKFSPENLTSFLEYDKENWERLNNGLRDAGLIDSPEWKLLKRGHENLVTDIKYLNEVSKRILKEE